MGCINLKQGINVSCVKPARKYFQQVVLINRADVNNVLIQGSTTVEGAYLCRHRISFDLKPNLTGYRFTGNEQGASMFGYFDKSSVDGIPQYSHTVNIIVSGIGENTKCVLKQLDSGDYFAALQYKDGRVEIFGFRYGLQTVNYSYNPQNNDGGGVISLRSLTESLEDDPPYIYNGDTSDFDNNFKDVVFNPDGDFNDDFNTDFNNQDNND